MSQLLYLSNDKLGQFMRTDASLLRRMPKLSGASISLAGVDLKAEFGAKGARSAVLKKLDEVQRSILNSDHGLWSFDDPEVRDGSWVEFCLRLHHSVVSSEEYRLLVLAQPKEQAGECGLLLYGSPSNLTRRTVPGRNDLATLDSSAESLERIIQSLHRGTQSGRDLFRNGGWFEQGVVSLEKHLQERAVGSPMLSGWCQVVSVIDRPSTGQVTPGQSRRIVVASPLFIAFSDFLDA